MGSSEYVIRGFQRTDLERVMDINVKCLPENYSSLFYLDLYERYPETFLTAVVDDQIQGYVMCRIERSLSKLKALHFTRLCHVVSVAVMPSYRRRGIATDLMEAAMAKAHSTYGASEIFLEVRISNLPALNLYGKMGFTKTRRLVGYYMNGEDAWEMGKSLEGSKDWTSSQ